MQIARMDHFHSVLGTLNTRRLPAVLKSAVVALPSDRETAKIKGDALYCRVYFGDPCKLPAHLVSTSCHTLHACAGQVYMRGYTEITFMHSHLGRCR